MVSRSLGSPGFGLLGEHFFEMGEDAVFEGLFSEGAKDGQLFFAVR
jgi:hypothetical protein